MPSPGRERLERLIKRVEMDESVLASISYSRAFLDTLVLTYELDLEKIIKNKSGAFGVIFFGNIGPLSPPVLPGADALRSSLLAAGFKNGLSASLYIQNIGNSGPVFSVIGRTPDESVHMGFSIANPLNISPHESLWRERATQKINDNTEVRIASFEFSKRWPVRFVDPMSKIVFSNWFFEQVVIPNFGQMSFTPKKL